MAITIPGKSKDYNFEGPYRLTTSLNDLSGVYAIISARNNGNFIIDVGESSAVKTRIENHDRKDCWERNRQSGEVKYAVYYTPGLTQEERRKIEKDIRDKNVIPCGSQ